MAKKNKDNLIDIEEKKGNKVVTILIAVLYCGLVFSRYL